MEIEFPITISTNINSSNIQSLFSKPFYITRSILGTLVITETNINFLQDVIWNHIRNQLMNYFVNTYGTIVSQSPTTKLFTLTCRAYIEC